MKKTGSGHGHKFYGGVKLFHKAAAVMPIEDMPLPKKVAIPLLHHCGEPAKPLVSKGDSVLLGEKIAESSGPFSVCHHSSVSGKVSGIILQQHPFTGRAMDSIVIESNDKAASAPRMKSHSDYYSYTPAQLISVIKEAGILGSYEDTSPVYSEISLHHGVEPDTLIINCCNSEPYVCSDQGLIIEKTKEIVEGAKYLMYILNTVRTVFALQIDRPDVVEVVRKMIFNEPNMFVAELKSVYPQGAKQQLIKAVTGRDVPSHSSGIEKGVVVQSISSAYFVSRALNEGETVTTKIVTVAGSGINTQKNIRVRIGTAVNDIIEFCGGLKQDCAQFVMGGAMTGVAQVSTNVPVLKGTSSLIFFKKDEVLENKNYDCFWCGKCVRACPVRIYPNMISDAIQYKNVNKISGYNVQECTECGVCAYVCPAKRPLVEHIRQAKRQDVQSTKKL